MRDENNGSDFETEPVLQSVEEEAEEEEEEEEEEVGFVGGVMVREAVHRVPSWV